MSACWFPGPQAPLWLFLSIRPPPSCAMLPHTHSTQGPKPGVSLQGSGQLSPLSLQPLLGHPLLQALGSQNPGDLRQPAPWPDLNNLASSPPTTCLPLATPLGAFVISCPATSDIFTGVLLLALFPLSSVIHIGPHATDSFLFCLSNIDWASALCWVLGLPLG